MYRVAFVLIFFIGLLFSGCSTNAIPEERLAFDYLDEDALKLGPSSEELTYSEIDGLYVHDFIKENKNKHVRWTASVHRIEDERTIELKEDKLPTIYVNLNEALDDSKIGDVVTVIGVLTGYGETFGKDPIWVVTPARLEEPTRDELEKVEQFRERLGLSK
ncbi:hypothetical protein [Bacillus sp. FJAT-45066]|uniref:hypothetical protein n=1 Tax=Bacillus sp. FJAT-45066 TaxID=2011010 RepID=UPI000BB8A5BA|nr:hypothetical protein [Bacillus sp. FJAT-45066]